MPSYHLDANRINARQNDDLVNRLESWNERGLISLYMSRTAYDEARCGSNQRAIKADDYVWIDVEEGIRRSPQLFGSIEKILFPLGAKDENELNDVRIVFAAQQTRATLITKDGNTLRNAHLLAPFGITVISTLAAVEEISASLQGAGRGG